MLLSHCRYCKRTPKLVVFPFYQNTLCTVKFSALAGVKSILNLNLKYTDIK